MLQNHPQVNPIECHYCLVSIGWGNGLVLLGMQAINWNYPEHIMPFVDTRGQWVNVLLYE